MKYSFESKKDNRKITHITAALMIFARGSNLYGYLGNDLKRSVDGGKTWSTLKTFLATPTAGMETSSGAILVKSGTSLWRSNDNGVNWTEVQTGVKDALFHSFDENINSVPKTIMWAEYGGVVGDYKVWKSTDDGSTWTSVLSKNNPAEIRHFHSVNYIPDLAKWIVTYGDALAGWYESMDNGVTWTLNAHSQNKQEYRTLNVHYLPDGAGKGTYVWSTDSEGFITPAVYSAPSSDISSTKRLLTLPRLSWVLIGSGNRILVATRPESKGRDFIARIFLSEDEGVTWEQIVAWPCPAGLTYGGFIRAFIDNNGDYYFVGDKLGTPTGETYGVLKIQLDSH